MPEDLSELLQQPGKTAAAPPPTARASSRPAKASSGSVDLSDLIPSNRSAGAPPPDTDTPSNDTFLSRSVLKSMTGKGFSDRIDGLVPDSIKSKYKGNFSVELADELSKFGPQVADFVSSPTGIALVGAHMVPYTRPLAAVADIGMGAVGAIRSIPELLHAYREPTPKNWAAAIAEIGMSVGMLKGGKKVFKEQFPAGPRADLAERARLVEEVKAAPPGAAKIETLEAGGDPRPKTRRETLREKIYRTPYVRAAASMLEVPRPKLLEVSRDLVKDKNALLAQRAHHADQLLHYFRKEVPASERTIQKMGYVIQGDATADQVGLSPKAREWVGKIREFNHEQEAFLREAYGDDIPLQDSEHYLAQNWDFGKDPNARSKAARTLMKDPYLKRRTIESYKSGIEEHGLKPRYDDVADLLKRRADFAAKAIANQRHANTLRELGVILSEDEAKAAGATHWPEATEANALNRATYSGRTAEGDPAFRLKPVRVHPDFEMAVNSVFGKGFDNVPGYVKAEAARAGGKKFSLSFAMFHHGALSEQSHALYTLRNPLKALKQTYFVNPEYGRGLKTGMWEVLGRPEKGDAPPALRLQNTERVQGWLGDGLQLKTDDAEAVITRQLREAGRDDGPLGKALKAPLRRLGDISQVWDRGLWDFYHQGQMLNAAEMILSDELRRMGPNASPLEITARRRAIAEHVNNAYGSVNYENLLVSPRGRQAMNWIFLAPSWTLSNLRILTAGFENEAGKRLVGKWAAGGVLSWFLSTQMLNYASTKYWNMPDKNGKQGGHFSWDNAGAPMRLLGKEVTDLTENAVNISYGYNRDGTQRYIRFGKAFREPFLWLLNPTDTLASKTSLPLQQVAIQYTKHQPGSGFEVINSKDTPAEQNMQRVAALTNLAIPFGARDLLQEGLHKVAPSAFREPAASSQVLSLPATRGITQQRAVRAYRDAMDEGRSDLAQEVLTAARQNHIDPRLVVREYRVEKRKKQRQITGRTKHYDAHGNRIEEEGGTPPPAARPKPGAIDLSDLLEKR